MKRNSIVNLESDFCDVLLCFVTFPYGILGQVWYLIVLIPDLRHRSCFVNIEHQYILNKSENATLQYFIFCEKVLDKKYLLKLDNVPQTSSKRFVKTPSICLF